MSSGSTRKSGKSAAKSAAKAAARRAPERAASIDVPRMISIGYGNLVSTGRVIAVVSPQSNPMRRLREEAGQRGKLIDATEGRRTRSILVTDSDHVILSAINTETIAARLSPEETEEGSA